MKLFLWKRSIQDRYSQLLAIIILLFLVAPNLDGTTGQILVSAVFLGIIIAIIRTFNLDKRFFFLLLMLAGTSFSLDLYTKLQGNLEREKLFGLLVPTIYCIPLYSSPDW